MKVLIAIFIFFSSLTLFSQSQYCTQDLYPMRGANKMMGYVNVQREWVVQPFFDKASSFTGNMALVQRKGKIGAINCDGKLILRCEYDEILPFLGGRAWFRKQTKWGLLNDKGTIIIEPKYEEIREIAKYTDQTWVRLNEKWGVVDKFKNEVIWECTFNTYNQTIDATHAFVTSERFNGLIRVDSKTKVVNDIIVLDDYLKRKYIVQLSSGKQGVIDYSGKIIINFDADSIIFSKQMYIVHNLGKSSLYNIQGKKIKNGFDDMKPFNNRFIAQVKKGGLVNFITRKGKVIFKHKYLSLEYCADHNNFVAQNEKGYFLVNNSEKVISPYFKRIKRGNGYFVGISNKNEQQLISTLGKVDENIFLDIKQEDTLTQIRVKSKTTAKYGFYDLALMQHKTPYQFDELSSLVKGYSVFKKDSKFGVINNSYTEIISDQSNIEVVDAKHKIFFISTKNHNKGVFLKSGKPLISQVYREIQLLNDYFIVTNQKGKQGVVSLSGKVILADENTNVISLSNNKFAVSKKGKVFLIYNYKGKVLYNTTKFEGVKSIDYNLIPVKKNGLWGYINQKNGKQVVDYLYKDAFTYSEIDGEVLGKVVKQTGATVYLTLRGKEKK